MLARRAWARQHQDHLRRAVMFEPRGHADMYGAILTEPEREDSDTGVLFMHNEGFSTMCGHGIIAVTTIAFERGLISTPVAAGSGEARLTLDAPAGQIRARAELVTRGGATSSWPPDCRSPWAAAPSTPTSRSAARSTPSWTPSRPAFRSHPSGSRSSGKPV
jgi:hypothetical protein